MKTTEKTESVKVAGFSKHPFNELVGKVTTSKTTSHDMIAMLSNCNLSPVIVVHK